MSIPICLKLFTPSYCDISHIYISGELTIGYYLSANPTNSNLRLLKMIAYEFRN